MDVTINVYGPVHVTERSPCGKNVPKVGDNPAPPIDDTITIPKPPASGTWCFCVTDGVIPNPATWTQS